MNSPYWLLYVICSLTALTWILCAGISKWNPLPYAQQIRLWRRKRNILLILSILNSLLAIFCWFHSSDQFFKRVSLAEIGTDLVVATAFALTIVTQMHYSELKQFEIKQCQNKPKPWSATR